MGLLDVPGPALSWIDGWLTAIPAAARLVLWGGVGGVATMWLYRMVSPQARIASGKRQQLLLRKRLNDFDGELADAWPLMRRLLRLSVAQVGLVTGPAVVASLPVLCLLVWISTAYGHQFPARSPPAVQALPSTLQALWVGEPGPQGHILVLDGHQRPLAEVPVAAPVPVIERWHWWNLLVANPAGYLEEGHPARRLEITLPRQSILQVGPGWIRGWEFCFFLSLVTVSLIMKRVLRIH